MDLINEVDSQLNSNFEDVKNLNFLFHAMQRQKEVDLKRSMNYLKIM